MAEEGRLSSKTLFSGSTKSIPLHRFPFTDVQVTLENLVFKHQSREQNLLIGQHPATHPYSKILVLNLSFSFPFAFLLSKIVRFSSYIIIFNHMFILLLTFTSNSLQFRVLGGF